jgi:hypothetical protein
LSSTCGHSATHPCRQCTVSKDLLFDSTWICALHERREENHLALLRHCSNLEERQKSELIKQTGWRLERSPFEGLRFDCTRQMPPDPYHLLLENLCKPFFQGVYNKLLNEGEREMVSARFHSLDYPRGMPKLAFPFNARLPDRFGFTQVNRLFLMCL